MYDIVSFFLEQIKRSLRYKKEKRFLISAAGEISPAVVYCRMSRSASSWMLIPEKLPEVMMSKTLSV